MKLFIVIFLIIFVSIINISSANVTVFQRKNIFLIRRKRYVQWPKGSNFVINLTCSKPLLRYQPLTWNTVYEMDIPFAVATDIKTFLGKKSEKIKRHVLERRSLLEHLEDFTTIMGYNGVVCVKRLLCESEQFTLLLGHSMVQDFIKVLFASFVNDERTLNCEVINLKLCPVSLLSIFINSSVRNDNQKKLTLEN
ncbi:hypothetical protein ABEB36_002048 [Hypothenemus hampei]|uniref:Uncharacterized protein n=1 Tax=Hypothenemus hampei TaxID=57062 RepID=A0ABD1F521_HYPHA